VSDPFDFTPIQWRVGTVRHGILPEIVASRLHESLSSGMPQQFTRTGVIEQ
jgi:hypothetical protein